MIFTRMGIASVFNAGDGNDYLNVGGKANLVFGGQGDDNISIAGTGVLDIAQALRSKNPTKLISNIAAVVDAGEGNDVISLNGLGGVVEGGDGDDLIKIGEGLSGLTSGLLTSLDGGKGNDTYSFNIDTLQLSHFFQYAWINNNGDLDTTDTLLFGGQVSASDISFQRFDDDLEVGILGTNRHFILQDWYVNAFERIDEFKISNGSSLQQSQVDNLVTAWDNFNAATINQSALLLIV